MRSLRLMMSAALVLVSAACLTSQAHAFGMTGAGAKGGYLSPEDRDNTGVLGAHVELEQKDSRVHLLPGFMYWNSDRTSDFNPNVDVYYHFRPEGKVTPYVGTGLGVHRLKTGVNDETDLGVNLLGGVRIPMSDSHVFIEGRHEMSTVSQTALLAGATWHFGGR